MAKAVKQLMGTNSSVIQMYAQSESGQWFKRIRDKGAYGWYWTKWQPSIDPTGGYVREASQYEKGNVRLPA